MAQTALNIEFPDSALLWTLKVPKDQLSKFLHHTNSTPLISRPNQAVQFAAETVQGINIPQAVYAEVINASKGRPGGKKNRKCRVDILSPVRSVDAITIHYGDVLLNPDACISVSIFDFPPLNFYLFRGIFFHDNSKKTGQTETVY